jgi:hypothetical protein
MPITGKHLKIMPMGEKAQGVVLEGNPQKPEPMHFRVCFPGGEVAITQCPKGHYWVHIDRDMRGKNGETEHEFKRARLDIQNKHANETDYGDFNNPNLYHVAFLFGPKGIDMDGTEEGEEE